MTVQITYNGPWKLAGYNSDHADIDVLDARGRLVAEVTEWDAPFPNMDNARLVSAAPELLASLLELLAIAPTFMPDRTTSNLPKIERARAAIEKATGIGIAEL